MPAPPCAGEAADTWAMNSEKVVGAGRGAYGSGWGEGEGMVGGWMDEWVMVDGGCTASRWIR